MRTISHILMLPSALHVSWVGCVLAAALLHAAHAMDAPTLQPAPKSAPALSLPQPASTESPKQPLSKAELQNLFTKGNELFRDAFEKAKTDRPASESMFREAAAAWRTVASQGNIHNVQLETNIANASMFANDLPRAIAAYRRAQQIDPLNTDVRAGLAAARRAAGTEALASGTPQTDSASKTVGGFTGTVSQIFGFLQSSAARTSLYLPPRLLFWTTCTLYLAAFAVGIARVLRFNRIQLWAPALLLVLGMLAASPLLARETLHRHMHDAVVIQPNTVARNGPAELYDAAFKEPLRSGLEARIEEVRSGWAKIRLADGRVAWVPETSLETL